MRAKRDRGTHLMLSHMELISQKRYGNVLHYSLDTAHDWSVRGLFFVVVFFPLGIDYIQLLFQIFWEQKQGRKVRLSGLKK